MKTNNTNDTGAARQLGHRSDKGAGTLSSEPQDEAYYKFDKSLYDLFYEAFEAGESLTLQRHFEGDPGAKHRYADRCIKNARNAVADLLQAHTTQATNRSIERARVEGQLKTVDDVFALSPKGSFNNWKPMDAWKFYERLKDYEKQLTAELERLSKDE